MTLLRRHRIARGMTQDALATKLGVVPSAVCFWESGAKSPAPNKYKKLARLLGVSPMELTKIIERESDPISAK